MRYCVILLLVVSAAHFLGVQPCVGQSPADAKAKQTKVSPNEIDSLLVNPGMGWQTFHQFADHDKSLDGLPSSSAYFRFYWREIEPQDGKPDFDMLDNLLSSSRRAGQKLALRVMVVGSGAEVECPVWLKDAGCKGTEYLYGGKKHWLPDFSDPVFQEKHFALIHALGQRYDGNPDFDLLDLGSIGMWGECNMSGVTDPATGKPASLPSDEVQNKILDEWCQAFPKTTKVTLIGSNVGMVRAAKDHFGWRADCFGDMGGFSKTWNHMEKFYPQQIKLTKAEDVWKTGPVAFETCWDMQRWKENGWNIKDIFDYGLNLHASYLNNKSSPIPAGTRPEIERFLRKIGYRLVIRSLEHDADVVAGAKLNVDIQWENTGVAPPYRDYRIAVQLRDKHSPPAKPITLVSESSIRGWLPGKVSSELSLAIPADADAGRYELAIGLVEPETTIPAVRLAIEGRDDGGWYPLSSVRISRK